LPDSSRVWLNSETSLRYPVAFNGKTREVTIEGEAFFKVKKNPDKPFFVNTSDIKVKVYGTSFNVKAYPTERYIETTLIEGKLSITPKQGKLDGNQEIFLKPKDKLTYRKEGLNPHGISETDISKQSKLNTVQQAKNTAPQVILAQNINPDQENLWKDGKLLFNNEKFIDLAIKLERWYDVKIHFENEEIKNFRFTGYFDKETINQAMEALKISSQRSYSYKLIFRDIYLSSK
jgi:transmembrane sensor